MGNKQKPFKDIFGKPTQNPVKKNTAKIKTVRFNSFIEAYNCKNRITDNDKVCINTVCKCKYKLFNLKNAILEYNQQTINISIHEKNIKISKYENTVLNFHWSYSNHKSRLKMIIKLINNLHYIYDLDLIPIYNEDDKVNNALEAYKCKKRKKSKILCCKCHDKNYRETVFDCYCQFSLLTHKELDIEASREAFKKLLKYRKLELWEKIVLTYNWNKISDKQIKSYNGFLIKYFKLIPRMESIKKNKKP